MRNHRPVLRLRSGLALSKVEVPVTRNQKRSELVVATRNKKKLKEIKFLLKDLNLKITSLSDYPNVPKIKEDGKTFAENAKKKALTSFRRLRKMCLGEDSGLEVEVLQGDPGVHSSRFAGKTASDKKNNQKLLKLLKGMPLNKRKAKYRCSVAIANKAGILGVAEGVCFGLIGFEPKGNFGFGYDPLFIIPKYKKTFAELGSQIKHKMSHRGKALRKAKRLILKKI